MMRSRPFPVSDFVIYRFRHCTDYYAYKTLGAHPVVHGGIGGYAFVVWAPHAQAISLLWHGNAWKAGKSPLYSVGKSGLWSAFIPHMQSGTLYKFAVLGCDGILREKGDPYAFQAEMRPAVASVTSELGKYTWHDHAWIQKRKEIGLPLQEPISIYEVHLGSWQRYYGDGASPFASYESLAAGLISHVKRLGFTHIELMPVAEHPLDASWGYQTGYYFAPSARFGHADDFRRFVDRLHGADIGIIMDWVPAHFSKDSWSLGRFDGTGLYEHMDPRLGEHPDWQTYIFNYGRREVCNFLLSNAFYWLEEFHIDGLRMDAVASMLYRDYSRREGEWIPNSMGGRENVEAMAFLQELNSAIHAHFAGVMTIAEDSTAAESTPWKGVTRPVYDGGLGFSFKWDMGFMHDTLRYMAREPQERVAHQEELSFSMLYAGTENFVLSLSHDEVVHGKGSLLAKMSSGADGAPWKKFANLRLLYAFMWAHTGKKLLFMGGEFAQWQEWCEWCELDWSLYDEPHHAGMHRLIHDLNALLRAYPAMYRHDCVDIEKGFMWLDIEPAHGALLAFARMAEGEKALLWVFYTGDAAPFSCQISCQIRCPALVWKREGKLCTGWQVLCNTDSFVYGGSGFDDAYISAAVFEGDYVLSLQLMPLTAICLCPVYDDEPSHTESSCP